MCWGWGRRKGKGWGFAVSEDGLPGNPETAASVCSIWVTREEKRQSLLRASKDMLGCNVGMALLLSPTPLMHTKELLAFSTSVVYTRGLHQLRFWYRDT